MLNSGVSSCSFTAFRFSVRFWWSSVPADASQGDQDGTYLRASLRILGVAGDKMKDANYCEWEGIRCDEESKKCVEWIDVAEKNLTGELPMELGKLANLTNLWLGENLLLSGNLHALSPLVKLRQLELPNTQITGELDALQGMKQLEYLVLSQSLVHGKLEALQELKQLRELSLSRTNVSGDLGALQELVDIEDVQLSETQVTGHLKALHGLGHLIRLDLSKTKITGTLQDLLKFPELEQAALRQTEVTGRLTNDWLGGLPRLNVLDLAARAQGIKL